MNARESANSGPEVIGRRCGRCEQRMPPVGRGVCDEPFGADFDLLPDRICEKCEDELEATT